MVWKLILFFGSKYVKQIRSIPTAIFKLPKVLLVSRNPVPSVRTNKYLSRLATYLVNTPSRGTLVKNVYNNVLGGGRGLGFSRIFAASVEMRHKFKNHRSFETVNKVSATGVRSQFSRLFGHFRYNLTVPKFTDSTLLDPKEFIASGCNSAVWSAHVLQEEEKNDGPNELAIKVLYNYYDNRSPVETGDGRQQSVDAASHIKVIPPSCVLLHRQIKRECELRPQIEHPNIVPLIDHFVDYVPSFTSGSPLKTNETTSSGDFAVTSTSSDVAHVSGPSPCRVWANIESFPDGFSGEPLTFYMVMPKYEATLKDLFAHTWPPDHHNCTTAPPPTTTTLPTKPNSNSISTTKLISSHFDSNCGVQSIEEMRMKLIGANKSNNERCLTNEDVVSILAQLFEAIAELEKQGIAHRDIKPNNVLISLRKTSKVSLVGVCDRTPVSALDWLNDDEIQKSNSRFHVALTDFGCAIRVRPVDLTIPSKLSNLLRMLTNSQSTDTDVQYLIHSGNLALIAPEIASILHKQTNFEPPCLTNADYARSDLWAAATFVYPLVGLPNPFVSEALSSLDYDEMDLPQLPPHTPWVLSWLVSNCLKRSPLKRPAASFVADVLHTWCLVQRLNRQSNQSVVGNCFSSLISTLCLNNLDDDNFASLNKECIESLYNLVNIFWAADWITGAAQPPNGLRLRFYARVTPFRLALCLRLVYLQDCLTAYK